MTPKEKAESMVYSLIDNKLVRDSYFEKEISCEVYSSEFELKNAKQCALIAIRDTIWGYLDQQPEEIQNYWQEVKQEIEKL